MKDGLVTGGQLRVALKNARDAGRVAVEFARIEHRPDDQGTIDHHTVVYEYLAGRKLMSLKQGSSLVSQVQSHMCTDGTFLLRYGQ